MAKSVLDIIIKTVKQGGGDKEAVKGLVDIKGAIGQAGVAFAALAGAAYTINQALDATVGTFVNYASQVRNVQFVTGTTAEESSRLIQMTDDMKIGYESLTKIMTAAVKNGIEPTTDGIAALSDQYLALAPGAERAKFLLDNFGKSGGEMAEMMSKGSAAIKEMAASMDGGLILDRAALDSAREYEAAIDNLADAWEAVKVKVGREVAPVLTALMSDARDDAMFQLGKDMGLTSQQAREFGRSIREIDSAPIDSATRSYMAMAEAMDTTGAAAEDLEVNYGALMDMTLNLQDGYDRFAEKEGEIRQKIQETNSAFAAGTMTAAEHDQKLQELTGQLDENARAAEDWSKRTVFAMVQARLAASGGIDANEFTFLINLGEQMGIIDEKTATMAQGINEKLDTLDTSGAQAEVEDFATMWEDLLRLPHDQTFTITTEQTTTGDSGTVGDYYTGTCFLAGTFVALGNGSRREIQDMLAGDLVLTMEPETGETAQGRVRKVFLHESADHYVIGLTNGTELRVTGNHPIYASGGWMKAAELGIGFMLRGLDGEAVAVETITPVMAQRPVYNLEIDHPWHTYFASGVLVHNKATGGRVRAPGDGLQDTVMVPMANGEGVINAQAMNQPGMEGLLSALNSGRYGAAAGGGAPVTIYGGLTVVAQGGVRDVFDELGHGLG